MARLIDFLKNHEKQMQTLEASMRSNHLASTFLFVGSDEDSKKRAVLALAQMLLCEKENSPCGFCGACLRVEKEQSENILKIAPEKSTIKVEQSREILDYLSLRQIGKARIILIQDADALTIQASNALLKILEEPPAQTYFFLLAPSKMSLLSTIRSRSQIVYFESNLRALKVPPEDQDHWDFCGSILKILKTEPQYYLQSDFKDLFTNRDVALKSVRFWTYMLRDILVQKDSADLFLPQQSVEIGQMCFQLEQSISANRDLSLLFEEFWIKSSRLFN